VTRPDVLPPRASLDPDVCSGAAFDNGPSPSPTRIPSCGVLAQHERVALRCLELGRERDPAVAAIAPVAAGGRHALLVRHELGWTEDPQLSRADRPLPRS